LFIAILAPQGNCTRTPEGVPYPDLGEPSRAVRDLAVALGGLGHRVEVVTRRIVDPATPNLAEPHEELAEGVEVHRIEFGPAGYRRKEELWPVIREYAAKVIERHAAAPPDAALGVHAQGGLAGALIRKEAGRGFAWMPRSFGAAKLLRLGATEANLAALDGKFQFARRIAGERGALAFADLVVIGAAVEYDRVLGLPAYAGVTPPRARCRVVPPGIDATSFQPQARGEGAARAAIAEALQEDLHAARMDGPMVVVPGGSHRRGSELVEAAFAVEPALLAKASLVRVTAFDDPELESWRARLEERGLEGAAATVTAGETPARAALYRWLAARGSVLVIPGPHATGLAEGLEAAACGLPVLADTESVVGAALRGEGLAELADTTNAKALAGALLRLLDRPAGWALEQAEAVAHTHAWPEVASRLEPALDLVAGSQRLEPAAPLHPYFETGDAAMDVSLAELRAEIFPAESD
jgi:sucrose-phosphate synthase